MSSISKNITRVRDIARNQKFRVQYVQQPVLAGRKINVRFIQTVDKNDRRIIVIIISMIKRKHVTVTVNSIDNNYD